MGGMLRCIRNEYNLDQVENDINRTDSINYDEVFQNMKHKTNIYIDDEFKVIWIERKLFRQFRNRLSYFFVNVTPKTSNKRKKKNQ